MLSLHQFLLLMTVSISSDPTQHSWVSFNCCKDFWLPTLAVLENGIYAIFWVLSRQACCESKKHILSFCGLSSAYLFRNQTMGSCYCKQIMPLHSAIASVSSHKSCIFCHPNEILERASKQNVSWLNREVIRNVQRTWNLPAKWCWAIAWA